MDLNLEAYGAAVMTMLDMITQGNLISNITVEMKCQTCEIRQKCFEEGKREHLESFEDPEILYMAKIEQLMQDADDMDHHIIAMLLGNAKYSEIADSCYMTEGNVKYRVKKYMNICGCNTKKELLELLKEYLQ